MSNQKRFALLKQHEIGAAAWNEGAQDAVGSILVDSAEIDFTYTDATPSITASLINGSVVFARLQNFDALSVLGRSANSSGVGDEIAAGANDRLLARTSDTLAFQQLTVGMFPDAVVTFAKLQNADAVSVLGRSANSSGVMDEIAAGANDRLLRRTSDTLNFGQLTAGMFPNTVVPDAALSSNVPLLNALNTFTHASGMRVLTGTTANLADFGTPIAAIERAVSILRASGAPSVIGANYGTAGGGTLASPAAAQNSDGLVDIRGWGYTGSGFDQGGVIQFIATETWSGSQRGTQLRFRTVAAGTTIEANRLTLDSLRADFTMPVQLQGYTVATLPAGTQGDTAYVTDALAPAFLTAVVGGGAVVTPVFYDGTNWVAI